MTEKISCLMIAVGAALWGIIGIFVNGLYQYGLTSLQIVFLRALSTSLILIVYLYFKDKSLLKIKIKDSYYFIGTGILSIVFFNFCYFITIKKASLPIAVILLYTAPAFVMILSRILFNEKLTITKIVSVFLTIIGCILVTGYFQSGHKSIPIIAIFTGIGSGLGYALYSIFGKFALRKYDTMTVTTYTFIFAMISLFPISEVWNMTNLFIKPKFLVYVVSLGLFSTVLAFVLYTKGLVHVETGKASIIATIEPVVATIIGVLFLGDVLQVHQVIGISLVILAVILVQKNNEDKKVLKKKAS